MSDIQVGDFARTKEGYIGRYVKEGLVNKTVELKDNEMSWTTLKSNITKHSPNLIDIIEDEDIVILEYYVSNYRKRIQRIFEIEISGNDIYFLNHRCSFLYDKEKQKFLDGKGFNPIIKTIVTHEQFNSVMYKVKE